MGAIILCPRGSGIGLCWGRSRSPGPASARAAADPRMPRRETMEERAAPMLPETTAVRLRTQLDVLPLLLAATAGDGGVDEAAAERRPAPGKWSAREQLAHLARHHEVTGERLRRILAEPEPALPRYRAEDDPEWPRWAALPLATITGRLAALRAELVAAVAAIPPADLAPARRPPGAGGDADPSLARVLPAPRGASPLRDPATGAAADRQPAGERGPHSGAMELASGP